MQPLRPTRTGIAARPLRKDAQRTRQQVMDAAATLFAARGLEVGFDEIARAAGVGVGTVYRRFPDRDSLIDALFTDKVAELVGIASSALDIDDPWHAVAWFCEQSIAMQVNDRGLLQVLARGNFGHHQLAELRSTMSRLVGELVQRAQAAAVVRTDLEAVDLVLMAHLIGRLSLDDGGDVWRRYLALFLDAIRPVAQRPLPGPVPTVHAFEQIARRL